MLSGAPFFMTEEFTAVYRMHPLLPEQIEIYNPTNGSQITEIPTSATAFGDSHVLMETYAVPDLWYSFGLNKGGHLTLYNYPNFLTNITLDSGYTFSFFAQKQKPSSSNISFF